MEVGGWLQFRKILSKRNIALMYNLLVIGHFFFSFLGWSLYWSSKALVCNFWSSDKWCNLCFWHRLILGWPQCVTQWFHCMLCLPHLFFTSDFPVNSGFDMELPEFKIPRYKVLIKPQLPQLCWTGFWLYFCLCMSVCLSVDDISLRRIGRVCSAIEQQ